MKGYPLHEQGYKERGTRLYGEDGERAHERWEEYLASKEK